MPERFRKVPSTVDAYASTISHTFHERISPRRSCIWTECRKAVASSQGISEAFSTGSHAQYPPHPSVS